MLKKKKKKTIPVKRPLSASGPPATGQKPLPLTGIYRCWFALLFFAVAWQPLKLGFYLDDWPVCADLARHGLAFGWERLASIYHIDPTRPAIVPIRFALSSLFNASTLLWQAGIICGAATAAFAIALAALELLPGASRSACVIVACVAATWVVLPWSSALSFWPVLLPIQILVAGFAVLLRILFRGWQAGQPVVISAGLLYFSSVLVMRRFTSNSCRPSSSEVASSLWGGLR